MSPKSKTKSCAAKKMPTVKKSAAKKKSAVKKNKAPAAKKSPSRKTAAAGKPKSPAPAKREAKKKAAGKKTAVKKAVTKKVREAPAKKKTAKVLTPAEKRAQALALRRQRAAERKRKAVFRQLLLDKHQSLLQAYMASKGDTRMLTRDGTEDYIDYAVSSYVRDFLLSVTEMDRLRLQMVEQALQRLDSDEFGRCQQCAVDIPERRLEVEPWARYCVRCQELEDQGLLQHGEFDADYDEDDDEPDQGADGDLAAEKDVDVIEVDSEEDDVDVVEDTDDTDDSDDG